VKPTRKVYWPDHFGSDQMIINEEDFNPKIHFDELPEKSEKKPAGKSKDEPKGDKHESKSKGEPKGKEPKDDKQEDKQ
jgi:hypothetical protein